MAFLACDCFEIQQRHDLWCEVFGNTLKDTRDEYLEEVQNQPETTKALYAELRMRVEEKFGTDGDGYKEQILEIAKIQNYRLQNDFAHDKDNGQIICLQEGLRYYSALIKTGNLPTNERIQEIQKDFAQELRGHERTLQLQWEKNMSKGIELLL